MTLDLYWIPAPGLAGWPLSHAPGVGIGLKTKQAAGTPPGWTLLFLYWRKKKPLNWVWLMKAQQLPPVGIRYLSFPIPDRDVPSSMSAALLLVKEILTELESGRNVAVHCRQSIGRSGLIAVSLLATSGMDLKQAIQAVSTARGLTIPETPEQLRWLRRLPIKNMVTTS